MYQARTAEPLTFTSPAGFGASAAPFTAPLHYTSYHDDSNSRASTTSPVRNFSVQQRSRSIQEDDTDLGGQSSPTYPRKNSPMKLTEPAQALFVRALYDYDADDHTSLSFRQGDIIQVLNQLETGWWDGVMGNVRGWFPSNYCAVVSNPDEINDLLVARLNDPGDTSNESGVDDDYDDDPADDDIHSEGNPRLSQPILPIEGNTPLEQEEAAFWIPQATPDGRLFYFNTLTGYSTMELPLENPLLSNDAGPRDRSNFFIPDQTRPPPEMMARGVERDEDDYDGSASEGEGESLMFASQDSTLSRRHPSLGDGVSPATSMDSFHPSPSVPKPVPEGIAKTVSAAGIKSAPSRGAAAASPPQDATAAASTSAISPPSTIPRQFADDGLVTQMTWSSLVENMKQAVQSYRQALLRGDRSEYVRKAEDISDHLRMLLAAGSDTTDNHSGNPSIISTNRTLYPHFRDMMSKFSKLVLSSHIAASDWTGPDSITKCLQEADGVLQGVYGYAEVAQQQRGEDIKRVVPGFVFNSWTGGHWQNNGLRPGESTATSFLDPDGQDLPAEPSIPLDNGVLDQVDTLRKSLIASIRRLEEYLPLTHKVVDSVEHGRLSEGVCVGGLNVIEHYRPWAAVVESINLAPLGGWSQNPQLVDLNLQKQRVYETIADLVISCQAVASPLADEWAELRGDSLEDRLNGVRNLARQLENCISQVSFSLSLLQEQVPGQSLPPSTTTGKLNEEEEAVDQFRKSVSVRTSPSRRKAAESVSPPPTYSFGMEDETEKVRRNMQKAQRFFGQAPPTPVSRELTGSDESWFLKFDHEGEVFYDNKADPPTLKCGTLPGLVEQLTRHDKLDASFNNTFLLTYRSFTTAPELFDMLVQRFTIQPPFSLSKDDLQLWTEKKQKPIRFRVVNILKSWFEHYWMEPNDEANMNLLRQVHAFTKDSIATTKTPGSPQLLTVIEQRLRGQDTTMKRMVPTQNTAIPTPILPKNMKKLKFLDIDPTEFARQLTIIESRLYAKIRATECLNKTWQKKVAPGETDPAANVKALILHSNQLTNWVAEMILTQSDVKKRMTVIKHFVNVADRCRVINNYSTLTSIISALGTAPIHRLSRTWAQVGGRTSAILEQMRKLMASTKNFGEYRETLHHANPPCIPFFGVYLTDLTFIEDGIPSHTQSDLINFNKRVKTAEVIRDIQQYQNAPYQLQAVPELQDYILNNMQSANDVHDMYDRSLEVEPREREDEKIARLLSESGFL